MTEFLKFRRRYILKLVLLCAHGEDRLEGRKTEAFIETIFFCRIVCAFLLLMAIIWFRTKTQMQHNQICCTAKTSQPYKQRDKTLCFASEMFPKNRHLSFVICQACFEFLQSRLLRYVCLHSSFLPSHAFNYFRFYLLCHMLLLKFITKCAYL